VGSNATRVNDDATDSAPDTLDIDRARDFDLAVILDHVGGELRQRLDGHRVVLSDDDVGGDYVFALVHVEVSIRGFSRPFRV
jgi:hypothetical protein